MNRAQRRTFAVNFGKILDLAMVGVSVEAISALVQYYDRDLRCFTFRDFQLVPTMEEFEKILGCPMGGRRPYLFSGHYPAMARISELVKIPEVELVGKHQQRSGVRGLSSQYLEKKVHKLADDGDWELFMNVLALLIYGLVLLPSVDNFVSVAAIDALVAYIQRKESPVVAVLADTLGTLDLSYEKRGTRIICCLPSLYVWLVCHVFQHTGRSPCPLGDFSMCDDKHKVDWETHLASMNGTTIRWFPKWKETPNVLCRCGDFLNVPLMGTRGGINYNPILAIRQLGYPIRRPPSESAITPYLMKGLDRDDNGMLNRIRRAWGHMIKENEELRNRDGSMVGAYRKWLEERVQLIKLPQRPDGYNIPEEELFKDSEDVLALKAKLEKEKVAKGKLKGVVTGVRKECDRLRNINMSTIEALEQEMRRAQREETGRKRYQGALRGNSNELKLRRKERDKVEKENITLRDELRSCWESKESLKEHLDMMEKNMLVIIDQYGKKMMEEK